MLQVISAAIAAVIAILFGYMMWFPESTGSRPGSEFGSGLDWLTFFLYASGFVLWVAGLIRLLFARQRYQVILQAASGLVFLYPVAVFVMGSLRHRYFDVHVNAEYVVEWKVPAEWTSRDFKCEVNYVGGLGNCRVKRGPIQGDSLELAGGPVHVQCERQILQLQVWRDDRTAFDDYIFLVDLHDNKRAGEVSAWIAPQSWKSSSGRHAVPQFIRDGDVGGFSPVQNPIVQMRYRIVSLERQRGR
jgi:hypothetical protein